MGTEKLSDCWEFFDKIYCISLDERADRRNEAKIQFIKVGLFDKVEFVIEKKHPYNCEQGIYESHMTCINKGILADASNIVIFEDDIFFERFSPANLKRCSDFLSAKPNWNVLFFGCLVTGSKRTQNECVIKVKYRSLAHGYALNRRFAEVLIENPWQKIAFDDMLRSFKENFYAIYPSFAFQSNSATDNNKYLQLDKFRRLFGGLRRIQKRNEFFYRHRTIFIILHVILIVLIMLWIF